MDEENKLFKVSRDKYNEIIESYKKGNLIIMIDTASFRQLFCDNNASSGLENTIHIPIISKIILIRIVFFTLPFTGIAMSIFSILAFNFWAILILPILLVISLAVHSKASVGKQSIKGAIILLIIGIISLFFFSDKGLFFHLVLILFPLQIFLSKFLYYYTAKTVFKLLENNYSFFAIFYEAKYSNRSIIPMIFIEKIEDINKFFINKDYNL